MSDNIAARPRQWRITGYIPGDVLSDVLGALGAIGGATGVYTPYFSAGLAAAAAITNLIAPQLVAKQKYLERLFYGRSVFQFKTRDNETVANAVMSELMIERTAEAQNKLGIQVVIRELNILQAMAVGSIAQSATPISGTSQSIDSGSASQLGGTTSGTATPQLTHMHVGHV